MNQHGLNPAWHIGAPGHARDAALKITKFQLELLSVPDKLLMIESDFRGGIAKISHRHRKANNEYKESKFVSYLYANNLYGLAMSTQLPTYGLNG